MLVTSDSFASASASNQRIFKAIERLLNDGTYHSQFGKLVSVADEARNYTYKQELCDKVKIVDKKFIDERVACGLYEGAPKKVYYR